MDVVYFFGGRKDMTACLTLFLPDNCERRSASEHCTMGPCATERLCGPGRQHFSTADRHSTEICRKYLDCTSTFLSSREETLLSDTESGITTPICCCDPVTVTSAYTSVVHACSFYSYT